MIPTYFTGFNFSLLKIFLSNTFYSISNEREIIFIYDNCTNNEMGSTSRIVKFISESAELIYKSIFRITHIFFLLK